jgi:hypothetical protein
MPLVGLRAALKSREVTMGIILIRVAWAYLRVIEILV